MTAEIVPFGKYKGQPAELLLADTSYCEWLAAQPWFKERYPTVYQVIVNYGAEPADSPEHNAMQVAFLNDDLCFRLARRLFPRTDFDISGAQKALAGSPAVSLVERYSAHLTCKVKKPTASQVFEQDGWDVVIDINSAELTLNTTSLPDCTCAPCLCPEPQARWHLKRATPTLESEHFSHATSDSHCTPGCPWGDPAASWLVGPPSRPDRYGREVGRIFDAPWPPKILVELKPDLGDDFPSVLRQVLRYPHKYGDRRCVIARRYRFEQVTWDQVKKVFAASDITLIDETELASPSYDLAPYDPSARPDEF